SGVAQATLSPEGVLLEVNAALCRLSGYPRRDLLGRPVTEFMVEPDVALATRGMGRVAAGETFQLRRPQLLRHADGVTVETRVSLFPVRDADGAVRRLEAVVEDVSEAASARRELQLTEARWRSLASHSSDVALLCTADAQLLFASEAALSVFGYRCEELVGADGWAFVHPDDVEEVRAIWAAAAAAPAGTSQCFELRVRHADGSWRWVEETLTNQLDDPAVGAMVVNLLDISERKSAEAVLEELAGTDGLTGLATRAPLMASLDAAFAAGLAATTAVVVVDLTRLKLVNDTHGHRAGDDVLVEVAARLGRTLGDQGIVARLGGDRFAALVGGVGDVSELFEVCAALLDAVEDPLQLDGLELLLTATVGAALGPAADSGALLASAESALATAKTGETGPMHVVRAETTSTALCRARLIEDLRRALAADELVVHFQPVVQLSDGRPVGAEALVRWQHPDKGLLSPGAFIGAAEDSGLIIDVGHHVLRQACRAAARWAQLGGHRGAFHVAVNLSAKQLTRGGVVDAVRQALADTGAEPANLMLEVTESAVMSDVDVAVRTLQELREMGVAVAVDDFGTGYSSLTYLKRFPVTTLKIDRSFVAGLGKTDDDAAIVTSVINLARSMGLECIAEGVETEEQRLILQTLGCGRGQGFLWSPALDAATFHTWLGGRAAQGGPAADEEHGVASAPGQRTRRGAGPGLPVDPALAQRVADLSATGASLATMAAALNSDGQRTPEGRRWSARSVAQLLVSRGLRGS
ncbi:MAG TPA: EAL domain-containing protein, partial [Mycobacteriales bacterium]|nr:EAL domain-containing protein [Mycobacteriales bacterium]